MKKLLTIALLGIGGVVLAGCTIMKPASEDGMIEVKTEATTVTGAKDECLAQQFQRNETDQKCERVEPKAACLMAENQRNERTDTCEFNKDSCLAAGHQWNEQDASCEYTKEQCLEMNAQRDEQASKCEMMPVTAEQKMEDCLNDKGQRDYATNSCQTERDEANNEDDNPDQSVSSDDKMKGYTLAEVKLHATQENCRAAVDGSVYDLTNWIAKHPGGPDKIMAIC